MTSQAINPVALVTEFHEMGHLGVGNAISPTKKSVIDLRIRLIMEETFETVQALCVEDFTAERKLEVLDGLCDVVYVSAGTVVARGHTEVAHFLTPKNTGLNLSKIKDDTVRRGMMAEHLLTAATAACQVIRKLGPAAGDGPSNTIKFWCEQLNDCCYTVARHLGLPFESGFMEVQNANMSKRLKDGTVFHDAGGKLMKPPGFVGPNLKYALKHGKPKKRKPYTRLAVQYNDAKDLADDYGWKVVR